MATISEIVDDPEWQRLRLSLIGTWKLSPADNCVSLRRYLRSGGGKAELRRRRVHNYLTGSGFRSGAIKHPCIELLLAEIKGDRQ